MIDDKPSEREDIEFLLPWYEKGNLSAEEMARVEAFLARDEVLRSRLELVREEMFETIGANESLGMPGSAARDALMAQIAAEGGGAPERVGGGFGSWLSKLFPGGSSPGLSIAAAAAALVIVVQAVALVSLMSQDSAPGDYRTASGESEASAGGTFLLVRFTDDATASRIGALLKSVRARIVDGPKPGNAFKIQLSSKRLNDDERDRLMQTLLEASDIVAFASATR